jgi:hypothetical protein
MKGLVDLHRDAAVSVGAEVGTAVGTRRAALAQRDTCPLVGTTGTLEAYASAAVSVSRAEVSQGYTLRSASQSA